MPIAIIKPDYIRAEILMASPTTQLRDAIANAIAAERERCAQVAEHLNGWGKKPNSELAEHIAGVIREG